MSVGKLSLPGKKSFVGGEQNLSLCRTNLCSQCADKQPQRADTYPSRANMYPQHANRSLFGIKAAFVTDKDNFHSAQRQLFIRHKDEPHPVQREVFSPEKDRPRSGGTGCEMFFPPDTECLETIVYIGAQTLILPGHEKNFPVPVAPSVHPRAASPESRACAERRRSKRYDSYRHHPRSGREQHPH